MSSGDVIVFPDGYSFRETEFGPMTMAPCVECGTLVPYVAPDLAGNRPTAIPNRCTACLRRYHGLKV